MNEATEVQRETTQGTWVAIGAVGAVGSIHRVASGYEVKILRDGTSRGVYPSLDVAKNALHAALPPGSERPEFSEH
jgi:hypothetical protein